MTYREALEKGVEKREKLSVFQSALNAGDREAQEKIWRLLSADCTVCGYHRKRCGSCVLYGKSLCNADIFSLKTQAYWVFRKSTDNNEKLTAARQIRDTLREELRRVTEEEANNA
jgi:hypothetical protein